MRFTTIAVMTAMVLSVGAAVALRAQSLPQTAAALDGLIVKQMADANIMGVGAAVIVKRQVAWMKGYGFADYARTRPR